MRDYPDYTDMMQIVGSDIEVPIDIQGAYIQMPVDIQAQYITLDIDIVAQTVGNITIDIAAQTVGNIAVNLAASAITLNVNILTSAITLNVDITAQTFGNLNFDIKAQSVGIYSYPQWAAKALSDVNKFNLVSAAAGATETVIDWTVTGGEALYITEWGFNVDADVGVWALLFYTHNAVETLIAVSGGRVGNNHSFTKPIRVIAGDHVKINVMNLSTETRGLRADFSGYLL